MKNLKSYLAALSLVAALLCVTNANAQAPVPPQLTFYTVGSSAQFNTFALAAGASIFSGGPLCGNHHWSQKSNSTTHISLVDTRAGSSILNEDGNIWIVWNDQAAAGTTGGRLCLYLGVDSIVGVRGYQARATLSLPASLVNVADANIVPLLGLGDPLPSQIQAFANGITFNAANTDIRPEDAKFASMRVMTPFGGQAPGRSMTGQGYNGSAGIGTSIQSSQSGSKANPVDFAIDPGDVDPINGSAVRNYKEISIGAAPVLVIVNKSQAGAGHLGDPNLTNINRFMLAAALTGGVSRTRELFASRDNVLNDFALHTYIREPLSGTYNTMEWTVAASQERAGELYFVLGQVNGQDTNIDPTNTNCTAKPCNVESGNPLWHIFANADSVANHATRGRCVGTGECVNAVNNNADALGYAFWGFSNFAGKTNVKYLSVDGIEPLFGAATDNPNGVGAPPTCSPSCPLLSFPNIVNGNYPIWSYYRLMYDQFDTTGIAQAMVTYAQAASNPSTGIFTDMVPAPLMQVFRSHYGQAVRDNGVAFGPNNGFKAFVPETGGDMGGAVLTIQSEQDFIVDTNSQQVQLKQ